MTLDELKEAFPLDAPITFVVRATDSGGARLQWKYPGAVAGWETVPEPSIVCKFTNGQGMTVRPVRDVALSGSTPADPGHNGEVPSDGN